jgi:hypothetical protein
MVEGWREGWKSVRMFDIVDGVPAVMPAPTIPAKPSSTGAVAPAPAVSPTTPIAPK